jgi:hypothetical protein
VIRIRTDVAPFFGTISRVVNTQIDKLDNLLEFKAWFDITLAGLPPLPTAKSCVGGSPRLQLAVDTDGDGVSNGNAFGYFGPSPSFTGCPPQTWLSEDFTGAGDIAITPPLLFPSTGRVTPNEELEWDLTQFGGGFYNTWSQTEAFFTAMPFHQVCSVALVDDTFDAPGMTGTAYYDLFSAGKATLVDRGDIAGRGFAQGCLRVDHGDDHHGGDHDRDHDRNDNDDKYDRDRRDRQHG